MTRADLRRHAAQWIEGRTLRIFTVRVLGVGALFALDVSLGRRLGVAGYGAFAFVLVIATVIAHLAPLGWLNASTRLVRTYTSDHRTGLLKGSLIAAHVTTAVGVGAAGLILAAVAALTVPDSPADGTTLLRLALPLGIALATVELHRYILRGQHAGVLGEALPMLLLPLGVLGGLWGLSLDSVAEVVVAHVVVCGLILTLSTARIAGRLPPGIRHTHANFRLRAWTGMAGAMLLGTASDELTARAAVVVLGTLSTDEAVGLFQAAARLSLMTVFVLRAVTAAAAPRIAELYQAGRMAEVRTVYGRACLVSACGAVPFLLVYGLRPEFALGLFGADFAEGAPVLRILVIGYFASAATGPGATALMMIGRERAYGLLATLGLGLNVAGMLVLVPRFDALGAAMVTASVMVAVNLCYAAAMLHAIRRRHDGRRPVCSSTTVASD